MDIFACDYLQDKTIFDLLERLSTPYSTDEEFQKAYLLLKDDPQFGLDIANNSANTRNQTATSLKQWCFSKYLLELTEDNIKTLFPKVRKYCSNNEERKEEIGGSGNSLSWKKLRKKIANKGISQKGQLFVKVVTGKEKGRMKTTVYCWDTKVNNWKGLLK